MSQGVECYSCLPKTAWPPTLKLEPNTLAELKVFGTPIKELTKEKNSAFQELSSVKEVGS